MARRKNAPDLVKVKCGVAERLRDLRTERYGERGGPELARNLGLPVRTWYNYEGGVTVPAEVILRLIELTHVEASWLLHGKPPKFREPGFGVCDLGPSASVEALLRSALEKLERGATSRREEHAAFPPHDTGFSADDLVLVRVDEADTAALTLASGPAYIAAMREWQAACLEHRCLRVVDEAMSPLVVPGAYVAYAVEDTPPGDLDGRLVVAWLDGAPPVVRRLYVSGTVAVLTAENTDAMPSTQLIDLARPTKSQRVRAVSWISTPR